MAGRISILTVLSLYTIKLHFLKSKMADGQHFEKSTNCHISATVQPIATNFARWHILTVWTVRTVLKNQFFKNPRWQIANILNKELIRRWDSECELFLWWHLQPLLRTALRKLPNSVKQGKIRAITAFNVTFGNNGKLIYDFLFVISTYLPAILCHFWDIAFDRSKMAIFGYPSCVQTPRRKGSLYHILVVIYC